MKVHRNDSPITHAYVDALMDAHQREVMHNPDLEMSEYAIVMRSALFQRFDMVVVEPPCDQPITQGSLFGLVMDARFVGVRESANTLRPCYEYLVEMMNGERVTCSEGALIAVPKHMNH